MIRSIQLFILFIFIIGNSYSQTKDRLPCVDKKFSVVVHVVLDSLNDPGILEADIRANFDKLNVDFAPICVSFEICDFDTVVNFKYNYLNASEENPEWKELPVLYNHKNRINVYYVKQLADGGEKYGYATLGGIANKDSSCVVVLKDAPACCTVWKALRHEMGHYFGLHDTFFASGSELVNGQNCGTTGDEICDTPPDPYFMGNSVNNYVTLPDCIFINKSKDINGQYYDPIVGNLMSHYQDECDCGFTHEQLKKMAATYLADKGMW